MKIASTGYQHCASCIASLLFPIVYRFSYEFLTHLVIIAVFCLRLCV